MERRPPLSDLTVQHVGQHMAVIVADTRRYATHAASLFDLRYDIRPPQLHVETCWQAPRRRTRRRRDLLRQLSSRSFRQTRGRENSRTVAGGRRARPSGAPAGALLDAAQRALPDRAVGPPSPSGTTIGSRSTTRPAGSRGGPRWRPPRAAEANVRVISPLVGGAFGSKSFLWMHVVLCAVAARDLGRPVKLVLTRNQMFSSTGHRPPDLSGRDAGCRRHRALASIEHHT